MSEPIEVLVVTSPGCHFCSDALDVLEDLAKIVPIRVETIPLASEQGRSLLVRHRVPFPPILVIEDEFFGYGRISRRKLEQHLSGLASEARSG